MPKVNTFATLFSAALALLAFQSFGTSHADEDSKPYVIKIGHACVDNSSCLNEIDHSYCNFSQWKHEGKVLRFCDCEPGHFPSDDHNRCVLPSALIGEPCRESQDCLPYAKLQKMMCLPGGQLCDCPPGYTQSNNFRECLPIVNNLGSADCREDSQCQLGRPGSLSTCQLKENRTEGVCRCKANAIDDFESGICRRKIGSVDTGGYASCQAQAQCTSKIKLSRCMKNVCECNPGATRTQDGSSCKLSL